MSGAAPPAAAGVVTPLGRAVDAYLDHLVVERGVAANTLLSYRRDLVRYVVWCTARGLGEPGRIAEADVSAFLGALRTGDGDHPALSASSAGRTVVAVRGFHRFALREGLAATDPAHQVRPPQPPRRLPKAIPVEQVEALLVAAGADETPAALRDRALLEVLYGSGARISEAVGLDIDDLDLDRERSCSGARVARSGSSRSGRTPGRRWAPTSCGPGPPSRSGGPGRPRCSSTSEAGG